MIAGGPGIATTFHDDRRHRPRFARRRRPGGRCDPAADRRAAARASGARRDDRGDGSAAPIRRTAAAAIEEAQAADQGRHHPVADAAGAGRAGLMPGPVGNPRLDAAVDAAFQASGPLARAQPGYVARVGQREMALAVARAIACAGLPGDAADPDANATLVAEAGTGTGKTFAYLVPALLSGGRVLISTGTRNLQDQLYHRDLPRVRDALGVGVTTALLKGRSNYVCRHHLRRNLEEGRFERREDIAVLRRIERFAAISGSGDRSEAPGIAEDAPAWARATSTRENCLGQDCPQLAE